MATTASVGVAYTSDPDEKADDLLRHADAAMYAAKELGRDRVEVFDDTLRSNVRRRLQNEIELRHAIEAGELEVYYQPEVEVPSGRLLGAEALVRWQHPTRGLLAAVEFIDLAEETGLILDLGVWVLREACRQQVAWQRRAPRPTRCCCGSTCRPARSASPTCSPRSSRSCGRPASSRPTSASRSPRPR